MKHEGGWRRAMRGMAGAVSLLAGLHAWGAGPSVHEHHGMADASAVASLGEPWFAVASDESNVLRIYRSDRDGEAAGLLDLSPHAGVVGKSGEIDIEGAARVGDRVYWVGSHGRNKEGKARPNRERLLATRVVGEGEDVRLEPVGVPCRRLLTDILADPRYAGLGLAQAAGKAPEKGGINIEGLAAGPEGTLRVGFRSPLVDGKALVATLLNPVEAIEGQAIRLGDPTLLDLGGRGIRDMTWTGEEWFVIGGGVQGAGKPRLFRWKAGDATPEAVKDTGFKHFHPEALAWREPRPTGRGELLVLSDDGGQKGAVAAARFRSFVVRLP